MKLQTVEWTAAAIVSFLSISRFLSLVSLFGGAFSLSSGLQVVGCCSRWTRTRIACWFYHAAWFFCRSVLIAIRSILDDHGGVAWFLHVYGLFTLVIVSIKRSLFRGATFKFIVSLWGKSFRSHIFWFSLWKTCLWF